MDVDRVVKLLPYFSSLFSSSILFSFENGKNDNDDDVSRHLALFLFLFAKVQQLLTRMVVP